jgi:hypothetical protein
MLTLEASVVNQPLPAGIFDVEGLRLRPGDRVADFLNKTVSRYDGERLVPEGEHPPWSRRTLFVVVNLALLAVLGIWIVHQAMVRGNRR